MFNAFLFRKTTKCQCNLCLRSIYKINLLIAFLFSIRGRDWRRLKPGQAILKTRNVPSVEDSQKFNTFHSEQWAKVHIWQRQRLCKKENSIFVSLLSFSDQNIFFFLSYDVICHMMFGAEASKNMLIFSIEVVYLICILTAMVQRRKVADGQRVFSNPASVLTWQ